MIKLIVEEVAPQIEETETDNSSQVSASNVKFEVVSRGNNGMRCAGTYWKGDNPVVCTFDIIGTDHDTAEFCNLKIQERFLDIGLNHKALEFAVQAARSLAVRALTPCFSHGKFDGTDYERRAWMQANTSKFGGTAPQSFINRGLDIEITLS